MRYINFILALFTVIILVIFLSFLDRVRENSKPPTIKTPREIYATAIKSSVLIKVQNLADPKKVGVGSGVIVKFKFSDEPFVLSAGHIPESAPIEQNEYFSIFYDEHNPEPLECCMIDNSSLYAGLDFALFRFKNQSVRKRFAKLAFPIGFSKDLQPSDPVYVMGVYKEADFIFSSGTIFSNHLLTINSFRPTSILIDNVFSFGSSGGPLINQYGQLVGINTNLYSETHASLYASVPIDDVVYEINLFHPALEGEAPISICHPFYSQIYFSNSWKLTDKELRLWGIESRPEKMGVLVLGFMDADIPAAQTLKPGDRIVLINNKPIHNQMEAYHAIYFCFQRKIPMTIERNREKLNIEVELIDFSDYEKLIFEKFMKGLELEDKKSTIEIFRF